MNLEIMNQFKLLNINQEIACITLDFEGDYSRIKKSSILKSRENFHLTPGEQVRDFTPDKEVRKQMVYSLDFS